METLVVLDSICSFATLLLVALGFVLAGIVFHSNG